MRFIGFTGHRDPAVFLDMLGRGFAWDAVQMPANVPDAHYQSFQKQILPILKERRIGAIGMKSLGDGALLRADVVTPAEAMRYAWSQPIDTLVSGIASREHLKQNVGFARQFRPMTQEEQAELLGRTESAAEGGRYEPFKG